MAVVIPWLLPREYRQHRILDPDGLTPTFKGWHAVAIRQATREARAGRRPRIVKVVIHPAELEAWSRETGCRIDGQTRADFLEMVWQAERDGLLAGATEHPGRGKRSVPL
jgi:hypothetical protein